MLTTMRRVLPWFAVLTLLVGGAWQSASSSTAERVGNDTCLLCHELPQTFFHTAHGGTECEDCHGPGQTHVEAGGEDPSTNIRILSAAQTSAICLECHQQRARLSHALLSSHDRAQVGCIDCHSIHREEPLDHLLVQESAELCSSCHTGVAAAFRKPFHHPVPEGAMECVSCHPPHRVDSQARLDMPLNDQSSCVNCHSSKQGPFVFEHAPLDVNGCQTCHEPHGSSNARMLTRPQVHLLCLECHTMTTGVFTSQPPAIHDLRSPRFRNCTLCHREIHGSNVNPLFLR